MQEDKDHPIVLVGISHAEGTEGEYLIHFKNLLHIYIKMVCIDNLGNVHVQTKQSVICYSL